MSKSRHVVPNSKGGWSVRSAGAARASRVFASQTEAVEYARGAARADHAVLYIHRRDGTVKDMRSFANDPAPQKG